MAAVGGDIIEITWNHPTLGTGVLYPKAGETGTFDPGGFRTSDEANNIDGSGRRIKTMTRQSWSVEVVVASDMNISEEMEKIAALHASPEDADYTFTHVNGTVYGGKGSPVGDLQNDTRAATIALKIQGGGVLKKIT
jgi:hypothetical protein